MIAERNTAREDARPPAMKLPEVFLGAVYEFQVLVLTHGHQASPNAELRSIIVRAHTADQAQAIVEACGQSVATVGPGRPLIDWSKPYLTRDEVEAMACCSSTTVTEAIDTGKLKKSSGRDRLYANKLVHEWIDGAWPQ